MSNTVNWGPSGWVETTGGNGINLGSTVIVATSPVLTATNGSLLLGNAPRFAENATTANVTVTEPGLYILSAAFAITITMPAVSQSAGGMFIFRNKSTQAHLLSCSNEINGTKSFCANPVVTASVGQGSKITLPGVVGSSVTLFCDGLNFCVAAASGSFTISGA